jgi:hypothetical protein
MLTKKSAKIVWNLHVDKKISEIPWNLHADEKKFEKFLRPAPCYFYAIKNSKHMHLPGFPT